MTNSITPQHTLTLDIIVEESRWNCIENIEEHIHRLCLDVLSTVHYPLAQTPTEIAFRLTNDMQIQQVNATYRDKNKATNVLSFPSETFVAGSYEVDHLPYVMLGDIIMAFETIADEAQRDRISLLDHSYHMIVHGLLHLLGYDHIKDEEANRMEALEAEILAHYHIANPYL